ncbi:MAG: GNAT family N-acetyltransferase [Lachnospiraceae bacterium]|nr:GNAT family N-acetyltransferase [Lachnospiraceae bacterium]
MIYVLEDTAKVEKLFEGWQETLIYSCLQKVMGKIYVTECDKPKAALAYVGCFGFFAGKPDIELVRGIPKGFSILTSRDEAWEKLIEEAYPEAKRVIRYAIKKDTSFNREKLRENLQLLAEGYEIKNIDSELYDLCLKSPVTSDFVASFESKEAFLRDGRGVVILKEGAIVSGSSSFTRYREGIEIEVDTVESERRKHLALIACSSLILRCLDEGLYPSWDAQNLNSVHLSEKLGYEFDHEYTAYEVRRD